MKRNLVLLGAIVIASACDAPSGGQSLAAETCHSLAPLAMMPADLDESSGVVFGARDAAVLWSHNDSGGQPELFALSVDGSLLGRVRVTAATNRDWEDIALGPCPEGTCLFIGDIGDNAGERDDLAIYVTPEPSPRAASTQPARRYPFRYPTGRPDAEALFITRDGSLFIVTKGGDSPIEVYRYPAPMVADSVVELELVRALSTGPVPLSDRVTAADARGDWVVIRTYTSLLLFRGLDPRDPVAGSPVRVDISSIAEGQGEGAALGPDGLVALSGEGFADEVPGSLALLRCPFLAGEEGDTGLGGTSGAVWRASAYAFIL